MSFIRNSTKRVMVSHIEEGIFEPKLNKLYTIFGQIKRVRIIAEIIEKREFFSNLDNEGTNFLLRDETGEIRVLSYSKDTELEIGDIVDCIGMIKKVDKEKYISCEIIRKVEDPKQSKRLHKLYITLRIKNKGTIDLAETRKLLNTMI